MSKNGQKNKDQKQDHELKNNRTQKPPSDERENMTEMEKNEIKQIEKIKDSNELALANEKKYKIN